MLPRDERLTSAQFDRAFSRSQSVRHPLVVLRAHQRDDGDENTRAAFVVPKKQGKATVRNEVRRRLRERYRLHRRRGALVGCDLIFLSTPETGRATNDQLDAALDEVLRRMSKKVGGGAALRDDSTRSTSAKSVVSPGEASPQTHEVAQFQSETQGEREADVPLEPSVNQGEGAEVMCAQALAPSILTRSALTLIRFYQRFISPGLPPSCRFLPTCSHYTYAAIERFGVGRGLWLGACRICRCNPFHPGGIDPVPELFPNTRSIRKLEKSLSWRRFWSSGPEG